MLGSNSSKYFYVFLICIAGGNSIIKRRLGSHLPMSQAMTWISNLISGGLLYIQLLKMRGDCCLVHIDEILFTITV